MYDKHLVSTKHQLFSFFEMDELVWFDECMHVLPKVFIDTKGMCFVKANIRLDVVFSYSFTDTDQGRQWVSKVYTLHLGSILDIIKYFVCHLSLLVYIALTLECMYIFDKTMPHSLKMYTWIVFIFSKTTNIVSSGWQQPRSIYLK